MPASGRRSKNCGNCRSIKRRCDQKFPHCGQCIRAHEECQGYRDEWELVFRDQTTHTIKRSKDARAKADGLETLKRSPPSRTLSLSSDEVGVNYFLFHFVVGGLSPSRGYLDYVPAVFSADGENPTLIASMAAVGLAALANSTQQPELSQRARTKYWEAIDKVNAALSSPVESIKDRTVALVVSRGKSQFSSPASIPMFNQVRADMCAACVHRLEPFPRDMLELQEEASKQADNSSCLWLLGVLATRTVNLLSDVTVTKIKDGATLAYFLEESAILQRDFQDVLGNFRTQEPYATIEDHSGDPDLIYNSRYDLYRSAWAIRLWNNSRILQVIICEIEFHLLSKALTAGLPPARQKEIATTLEKTCRILKTLGDDILATVPQSLGAVLSPAESPTSADLSSDPSANGSASGGHLLMWCLYTVGKSPVTRGRTRKWVMKRLRDIAQKSGLPIALQFVNDIDEIDKAASILESADN
ncbi:transcriptional regulator family: Fungal Specific TF [Penicillium roqueforti]|uniref:transcriptional regulator family: Fungal Specific TF n=1 Tax=Penicillium roqueforti TaxID=5082 RepID=UPI00190D8F1C|nr:transcriptional regulator family: Fungal Specific TF [Penicillium roqueforti]KAF9249025.1 transcriptional regulator family: Fungal Specific TF [Penicillium roqueforti]KAI1832151.1 transcriptional regulator family: Fungal Specific TF [Penicillium roqueforti]KAI2700164.1 transcriptional regulator family: Fungal Specific TF [Penicillium roqueforti]KAI2704645.1 transcriptional regulator family: Fungal Specific TF [Penicillium roqueforti]KAI2713904.1 transcriptional regulator family: Fungal Spec